MSDFDLERLGDVWRQQPDAAEMERLQRTAAAVSRRARYSQIVDVAAAVAIAGVVISLVASNPRGDAVLMGTAAILVLLYSNFRQRKLRQVELRNLTGSTENMLQQSVERIETQLKHNRVTLLGLGPTCVVGALFAAAAIGRSGTSAIRDIPLLRALLLGGSLAAVAVFILFLLFAIRRGRHEMDRLKAMREAYRQEHESTMN